MLVNRKGRVETIFIGDSHHLPFDKLQRPREAKYRLRGYRLLHTHLKNHNLSHPDLVTLLNERLDLIGVLEVRENGSPGRFQIAHILPPISKYDFSISSSISLTSSSKLMSTLPRSL